MEMKDNGGPAFPGSVCQDAIRPSGHNTGMTLRDYFAAKAMQGFAASDDRMVETWIDGLDSMARCAYQWADAMLKERGE
jgi:hypothetical protein